MGRNLGYIRRSGDKVEGWMGDPDFPVQVPIYCINHSF